MTPNQSLIVASIQMVSSTSVEDNLSKAEALIQSAKDSHGRMADLVVLPEYFCMMGHQDTDKVAIQENFNDGPIQSHISALAKKYGVYLVAGTIPLKSHSKSKVKNSSLVFSPSGDIICRYDKIHLFGLKLGAEEYQESRTIEAGQLPATFSIEKNGVSWKFGLSICYDIRFPELYRAMGEVDCQIIPAAFTHTTGKAHWETLLKARAIENQCYVLASGQGGRHENGRTTWGQSMLINPWGDIQSEIASGEGIACGKLEKSLIQDIRSKLPALQHRII